MLNHWDRQSDRCSSGSSIHTAEESLRLESQVKQYELHIAKQHEFYELREWKLNEEIRNLQAQLASLVESRKLAQPRHANTHCSLCSDGQVVDRLSKMLTNAETHHAGCLESRRDLSNENEQLKAKLKATQAEHDALCEKNQNLSQMFSAVTLDKEQALAALRLNERQLKDREQLTRDKEKEQLSRDTEQGQSFKERSQSLQRNSIGKQNYQQQQYRLDQQRCQASESMSQHRLAYEPMRRQESLRSVGKEQEVDRAQMIENMARIQEGISLKLMADRKTVPHKNNLNLHSNIDRSHLQSNVDRSLAEVDVNKMGMGRTYQTTRYCQENGKGYGQRMDHSYSNVENYIREAKQKATLPQMQLFTRQDSAQRLPTEASASLRYRYM